MTVTDPDAFYDILDGIRQACTNDLAEVGDKPARSELVTGGIAWDDCCGLLAVSAMRFYLVDQFPIDSNLSLPMPGAIYTCDAAIQIIRCAPQPQGTELSPSVEALAASARQVISDARIVMCATIEQLDADRDSGTVVDYMIRQQVPQGPTGACVGSELTVAIGIMR